MKDLSQWGIKQVGDKMVSVNVFQPTTLKSGDAVLVNYGGKIFAATVFDVRPNYAPNPANQNVVSLKGFPASLYVGHNYKSKQGTFPVQIMRVSYNVMSMAECMDAVDKLLDTGLF